VVLAGRAAGVEGRRGGLDIGRGEGSSLRCRPLEFVCWADVSYASSLLFSSTRSLVLSLVLVDTDPSFGLGQGKELAS
jgi:hypothetical protein